MAIIPPEAPFETIDNQLNTLDNSLEDGPDVGEAPEAFLRRIVDQAQSLLKLLKKLTPEDVDSEFEEIDANDES